MKEELIFLKNNTENYLNSKEFKMHNLQHFLRGAGYICSINKNSLNYEKLGKFIIELISLVKEEMKHWFEYGEKKIFVFTPSEYYDDISEIIHINKLSHKINIYVNDIKYDTIVIGVDDYGLPIKYYEDKKRNNNRLFSHIKIID